MELFQRRAHRPPLRQPRPSGLLRGRNQRRLAALILTLPFWSCADGRPTGPAGSEPEIIITPALSGLAVEEVVELFALDESGTRIQPEWSSSDETIAIVTADGLLQAVGEGEVIVYARMGPLQGRATFEVWPGNGHGNGDSGGGADGGEEASAEQDDAAAGDDDAADGAGGDDPDDGTSSGDDSADDAPSGDAPDDDASTGGATGGSDDPGIVGIWITPAELAAQPTSGASWDRMKTAADSDLRGGVLTERNDHNVRVLAAALVAARLDDDGYRQRVRDALGDVVASPLDPSNALAMLRRIGTYAIAADLIALGTFDSSFDSTFRAWLDHVRTFRFSGGAGGGTLAEYHERRPNNYGTHAGASRMAVALYLGDQQEFQRTLTVFRGWLGDRSAYAGFRYGDLDWQCDPDRPVGINPAGCTKEGRPIGGVLADDQRRSGRFTWPPPQENYVYEALQGALAMAAMATRQGYDAFQWSDRALLRAFEWLHDVADFPAVGDDTWQPWLVNHHYGTSFPAPTPSRPGKNVGWTDWTHR